MNNDQRLSLLRTLLKILGTVLVTAGYFNDGTWTAISGAIITIAPVVWDMFVNSTSAQISNVASMSQVRGVVTTTKGLADSIPNTKVVGTPGEVK